MWEFFVIAAAAIAALIEMVKRVWPEHKDNRIAVRILPAVPLILGVLVGLGYASLVAEGMHLLEGATYGLVAGSLSSSAYEMVAKVFTERYDEFA